MMMNNYKSLADISWQVTEKEYRSDKALSYSTLAKFHREGFNNLDKLFDKVESPSLLFGSLVDTLLTDSYNFDNLFVVAEFPPLVDSQMNVVKHLFNCYSNVYSSMYDIPDKEIIEATEMLEFQKNWKPETRAKVLRENGEDIYKLLHLSIDKTLVSTKDYQDAQLCVERLQNDDVTGPLFANDNPFDKNTERFFQLKFKGEYQGINLRCMMDLVVVNHEEKKIYPYDLKTSFKGEWEFPQSFIKWCYWIQSRLYWYILKQNLMKDDFYKDYELMNYQFIVISNNSRIPLIWEDSDTTTEGTTIYGAIECKDWREIAQDLTYYLEEPRVLPKGIGKINNIKNWLNNE